jgi:DNA-binding TFAR19-related protein (PDSD5 family)
MDNLTPSNIDPNEMPEGFSSVDPNAGAASGSQGPSKQQQQEQKQGILEQVLTPEALARLGRIKLVKDNKKVAQLENALVSMAMSGKLPGRVSEDKLIEMLERSVGSAAQGQGESKISFQRKKYAFDSDDEDDDDDDLM